MKLLVIDDNRNNVELVMDVFRSSGFQVLVAYDGTQGIQVAQENQPDVIF
jgi:CheY-like chemotaxis protein